MSGSLNKVILIGNLGGNPEVRTIPNGAKVASFSLATTEHFTNNDGHKIDKTEWHKIVLWRSLADITESFLKKGSSVYIEGKLSTRSWVDKDRNKKYITEIIGEKIQLLDSRKQSNRTEMEHEIL